MTESSMIDPSERRKERSWRLSAPPSANVLEMYDFIVFGYHAAAIGKTFFSKGSECATLMLALATFGVGFLMRPLGVIVLGSYIERKGRRAGLILTLGLMIGHLTDAGT
jgi:MFS family permease